MEKTAIKTRKYEYTAVIQQHYGQGWEDVSEYETDSQFRNFEKSGKTRLSKSGRIIEIPLISHDLQEYRLTGYSTRLITRKKLNKSILTP